MNLPDDKADFSVSVIIPAYNAEQSIKQAIDSVLVQTIQPDEIIVVDDGSTDRTAEIVKAFPQITYLYQENAGVSAACNTGINKSRYRWVAFLDSDDEWMPKKLELQMSLLHRNFNLKWAMCNFYFNNCQLNRKSIYVDQFKIQQLMREKESLGFFNGVLAGIGWVRCCVVVDRHVLEEIGGFRAGYSASEDLDLCVRIAYIYPDVGFLSVPLAEYNFRREGSLSLQSYTKLVNARCQNLDTLLDLSEKYRKKPEFERVASKLLVSWLRGLHAERTDEEKQTISDILVRFGRLLPRNYRTELRLKIIFPHLSTLLFNVYFKLKKTVGISENK